MFKIPGVPSKPIVPATPEEIASGAWCDDRCATCGHDARAHYISTGPCNECPAVRRCAKFVPKDGVRRR